MHSIEYIYTWLFREYGPQGWWPLINHNGSNPTKTGIIKGYHPGVYSFPHNDDERFEICIGAILTQNTTWVNVEKAIENLNKRERENPVSIANLDIEILKESIRPAGYFNQKAQKIKIFTDFYLKLNGKTPKSEELLDIGGIGPETADCMLLYGFNTTSFVVDAYSKRMLINLGLITESATYQEVKRLFEENIPRDLIMYQEYHALIVEHAKRYYQKQPYGENDPLKTLMDSNT